MATAYVGLMAVIAWRFNGELTTILRLGFEKDELTKHLAQENARADEANRAKSRFLAAASHDLRQPVHALSLFVAALQSAEMSAEAQRLVAHVGESVAALDGLFAALLNISQLDAAIVPNMPQTVPLHPLLERICRDYAAEAAAKGIILRLHPCSLWVLTDPALLERVLRNLVSNAIRYTHRGRVVVGGRRTKMQSGAAGVRIEVWDTGVGIPAALQDRVFEEFFQIGNPERDRSKGLGLGLSIVRRLAAIMPATLTIRSVVGRGSMFAITLDAASAAPNPAPPPPPPPVAGGLILVLDDERAIQTATRALLLSWGFDVITAGSTHEMLAQLADTTICPTLLICDYRLRDDEDGIAAIRRLQDEYNDELPAILITGDTAPERLLEAEASGLPLLHKPVTPTALRSAITSLIAARLPA
jgi:signal transduction histidine kinase